MSPHDSSKEYGSDSQDEKEELDVISADEGESGEIVSETDPDKATGATSVDSKNIRDIILPKTRVEVSKQHLNGKLWRKINKKIQQLDQREKKLKD